MPVRHIVTVSNASALAAGQQGPARDPARRAERLRFAGSNVATRTPVVPKISRRGVVADASGKPLASEPFREVSPPGSSIFDVDRLRSIPDSLHRLAL